MDLFDYIKTELKWSRVILNHRGALTSGHYKIVRYHYIGDVPVNKGTPKAERGYHVYFIPLGWPNWGNSIRNSGKHYLTLADAKKAAEIHYAEYGDKPKELDKIDN